MVVRIAQPVSFQTEALKCVRHANLALSRLMEALNVLHVQLVPSQQLRAVLALIAQSVFTNQTLVHPSAFHAVHLFIQTQLALLHCLSVWLVRLALM